MDHPFSETDQELNERAREAIEASEKAAAEFDRAVREAEELLEQQNAGVKPSDFSPG